MEEATKANIRMTKNMAKEFISGQMAESTTVNGSTVSNMESVLTHL
jgi:hypothetical protein